jgi:uncharacterized membrane protein YgdD (TMEM256/DUF423 family)
MKWSATGAFLLALAVTIGAFGAHALDGRLDDYSKGIYETGVRYHFYHALGLLIVSFLPRIGALPAKRAGWVCGLLLAGVVLFSGSLYTLALTGERMWGAVTPLGGVAFIAAWVMLGFWMITSPKPPA